MPQRKQPPTPVRVGRPEATHRSALLAALGLLLAFAASACSTAARAPTGPTTDAPQQPTPPAQRSSNWSEVKKTLTESARTPQEKKPTPPWHGVTLPELRDQLQAAGAQPANQATALPDDATLLEQAEQLVAQLVEALAAGDLAAALVLTTDAEETAACVSQGLVSILQGPLATRNESTLKGLVQAVGGKQIEHQWTPGLLYISKPKGTFRPGTMVLQQSELKLNADGVELSMTVDWLVWQGQRWSIFSISTP